jgi:FkbM family methyltransferase
MMALTAASSVGPNGKVFAMEPHPGIFTTLQHNISINRAVNICAKNVAVGASTGTVRFSDDRNDSGNHVTTEGPLTVPVETLDRLMADCASQIAMLKIDVEGYEKFVLDGAVSTLARTACVYFEAHDPMYASQGYKCADVVALLRRGGFHVYRWLPGNASICEIDETYKTSAAPENLLAVRDYGHFLLRTGSLYKLNANPVHLAHPTSLLKTSRKTISETDSGLVEDIS